jgi:ligand-binding SRPBCC domain-containing protein
LLIKTILNLLSFYQTFTLERQTVIDQPIDIVFSFFSDASNLEVLTPLWLNFNILTVLPIKMKAGAQINYKLKLHGIPVKWQSDITKWDPPNKFVDEQTQGPYTKWVHTHEFTETPQGILIKDRVEYQVPGGFISNFLYVRNQLNQIFDYRQNKMQEHFALEDS